MKYICQICKKVNNAKPCVVKSGRKKYCSLSCRYKGTARIMIGNKNNDNWDPTGINNPNWKGEEISYIGIHAWVTRQLGRPHQCENCLTKEYHRYEWANISGKYKRDLSDWVRLCVPCHRNYDNNASKGWITRRLGAENYDPNPS